MNTPHSNDSLAENQQASPASPETTPPVLDSVAGYLEEIADDLLSLMRRMKDIEEAQNAVQMRLNQLQEGWAQTSRTISREVDTLRKDLLGERRHTALTGILGELLPLIDRLNTMRVHLDVEQDSRMISQLVGVLDSLTNCLNRMGCEEFHITPGTAFDADRMQCSSDQVPGSPSVVGRMVQPGLRCGQLVLRRASVILAAPPTVVATSGDDFDE